MTKTTAMLNRAEFVDGRDKVDQVDDAFHSYLENRRRQLIGELRDIESHLLKAGRIDQPSLKPPRRRN